jgi:hypothetical protein
MGRRPLAGRLGPEEGTSAPDGSRASGLSIKARVNAAASATARQDGPSSVRSPSRPFCSVCMVSDQRAWPTNWIVTWATSPPEVSGFTEASRRTASLKARASGHSDGASSMRSNGRACVGSWDPCSREGGCSRVSCPESRQVHRRHRTNALRHGTEGHTTPMIALLHRVPTGPPGRVVPACFCVGPVATAPRPSGTHQSVKNAYE